MYFAYKIISTIQVTVILSRYQKQYYLLDTNSKRLYLYDNTVEISGTV